MRYTNISHRHTCLKHTTHLGNWINTTMYTQNEIKDGWNSHNNLDDLGLNFCTRELLVINNKNIISFKKINHALIK